MAEDNKNALRRNRFAIISSFYLFFTLSLSGILTGAPTLCAAFYIFGEMGLLIYDIYNPSHSECLPNDFRERSLQIVLIFGGLSLLGILLTLSYSNILQAVFLFLFIGLLPDRTEMPFLSQTTAIATSRLSPTSTSPFFDPKYEAFGKSFFRRTGKACTLCPVYASKKRRKIAIGEGISYAPENDAKIEKQRIVDALHDAMPHLSALLDNQPA